MQVALIAPTCQLYRVMDRPFQMLIPEGLKWPMYAQAYQAIAGERFIVLDNGMFESSIAPFEFLIETAIKYKVNEIVMPDTRDNMEETLRLTDEFLDMFLDSDAAEKDIGLQIVIQVPLPSQVPDFIDLAGELEWKHFGHGGVFTYGIPRRMVEKFGDHIRLGVVDFITAMTDNQIHLLGFARTQDPNFNETKRMAEIKQVRSMDTEAPFLWTAVNAQLGDGVRRQRGGKYLELEPYLFPRELLNQNIETLDGWANA